MEHVRDYVFILTLFLVAVCDISKRKIPNIILITGTLLLFAAGGEGFFLEEGLLTAVFAMALLFPLFLFRMAGAGDIKLVAFVFLAQGAEKGMKICVFALAGAALFSGIRLFQSKRAVERFMYFFSYVKSCVNGVFPGPYYVSERDGRDITLPFALFVLSGGLLKNFL